MTIVPKRLGIKFSLRQAPKLQPADIMPIFQRWIQDHTVDGMLIDVIDYQHVPDGPGIVLIADEADFAYDLGAGQPGLHYVRKRALPEDFSAALRLVFDGAMQGAQALEAEAPDDLVFDFSSAKINFLDRMTYRNEPGVFEGIRADLAAILSEIYGAEVSLSRVSEDRRWLFAVRADVQSEAIDLDDISRRLRESHRAV